MKPSLAMPPPTIALETDHTLPSTSGAFYNLSKAIFGDGSSDGGKGGETLQEWSSLIGIITAIVGNILIALALNVQRYAHTRLHKERISNRRRARAALRRSQNGPQSRSYGTVDGNSFDNINNASRKIDIRSGATTEREDVQASSSHESDPLTSSIHSEISADEGPDENAERAKSSSSYLKSPYWWLGQILITLGEMGNFLAYGFAPASIVSPLGVVALISNCLIAPLMFHERFRPRDFWGVVVAVGGVVTVVLSANTEETKLKPDDVWGAITSTPFEIYLVVTIVLIVVLMWASPRYGKRTILIDLGLVGLFGGYTALSTKGVSSMLSSTLWRAFATPVTYALLVILLGTAVMQIRYVNKSLQRFDSTQVIPIQFVMFTLCVIVGSAVLYRDFEKTTSKQAAKFVGGCLLTFFGVFLITSGREQNHDEDDALSDVDGVEETIGLEHQDANFEDAPQQASTPASVAATRSRRSSKNSGRSSIDNGSLISPGDPAQRPLLVHLGSSEDAPTQASTSILENPWSTPLGPATPPPRGVRTLSADTVMRGSTVISASSRSYPNTPSREDRATSSHQTDQLLTPQTRTNAPGGNNHTSRTGTFISPSPLASTVTTVMKDGLLYRDDSQAPSHKSSMRQLRSRIRASLFFNEEEGAPITQMPGLISEDDVFRATGFQEYRDEGVNVNDERPARTRSRSVSDALGDFFRPKRKRRKGESSGDVENGDGFVPPEGPAT